VHKLHDDIVDGEENPQLLDHDPALFSANGTHIAQRCLPSAQMRLYLYRLFSRRPYNAGDLVSASTLILIAAGIVALLAVSAFLGAVLMAQRGRTVAYYSVRRETQQRANRRLMLSLALLLFAGVLFAGSFMLPEADAPAAAPPVESTLAPATPVIPSPLPARTPALVPTALPRPTLAPETNDESTSPLPTPSPAVVAANKRLALNAIASGIDSNGMPAGAGTSFQAGTPTLYVFFDFQDLPPDVLLRHTWFRDGGSVYFSSQQMNENGAGLAAVQWSPRGGFQPGLYEVRLQLGGVPQFVANFEVK
jgi:hypothetical protein